MCRSRGHNTHFTFPKACDDALRGMLTCRDAITIAHSSVSPSSVAFPLCSPLQSLSEPAATTSVPGSSRGKSLGKPLLPLNTFPFDLLPFPGFTTYSTARYFGYLVPGLLMRDFRSPLSQQHGDSDFSLARRDRTRRAGDARKFLAFSWAICCPVPPCWKGL